MSREIKFRAWDKATNRMLVEGFHIIGEITCFGIIEQELMKEPLGRTVLDRIGDVEIMQYTGLKDKKGIDIYEGDICSTDSKEYARNKQVIWNERMACFEFDYPLGKSIMQQNDIEVIGNIHQHP